MLFVGFQKLDQEGILKNTDRLVKVPQQLGDLKLLQQPEAQLGTSPIAPQPPLDEQTTAVVDDANNQSSSVAIPAHFYYHDINVVSIEGLVPHLKINPSLPLFQLNPQLKNVVRNAVNQAVKELIVPVTERAIKVAMTATEHVCRKV
jgi:CCR4-NOT transcription complex subunit 1